MTPDFDQIARDIPILSCDACASGMRRASTGVHYDDAKGGVKWGLCQTVAVESIIAEQLRLVWNARGAADLATLESFRLFPEDPDVAPRATRKTIDRALRSLDR